MRERADRLERLARESPRSSGADPDLAARAGRLAKADLVSGLVGEFPELQGVMGGYYAARTGQPDAVSPRHRRALPAAGAVRRVPTAPVAIAVALAEKLDLIVGFFAIGEKPTGSRDPFALRRAALGVLRSCPRTACGFSWRDSSRLAGAVGGADGRGRRRLHPGAAEGLAARRAARGRTS